MNAPQRPLETLKTGDGSLTLYSGRYGQAYASRHGALTESRAVFLDGSGVVARVAAGESVRVLEVGFGTGLNFFLTAHTFLQHALLQREQYTGSQDQAGVGVGLHYTALEHDLLSADDLARLGYGALLECETLFSRYLGWRETLASGAVMGEGVGEVQRFTYADADTNARVTLELRLGDAAQPAAAGTLPKECVHAVYQDAFSPDANPELWTEAFLGALVAALHPGGTLVSYCVKGEVRRRLERLGLEAFRRSGPQGGKREVLVAYKPAKPAYSPAPERR